MAGALGFEP